VDAGDCPPAAACVDTAPSVDTGGACEVSGEPCADAGECPGGQACIFCPTSLCGDGVRDPGEGCDDANVVPGDGCDTTCQVEGTSVAVVPRKLIVIDKLASAGQAKVVYVAKDPNVTKGAGTDAGAVAATFEVAYDGVSGGFSVPSGAFDGTAGWKTNKTQVAKYVNKDAPNGTTATKVAVVKPGTLLKIVGASLGDAPIDLFAGGAPSTPVRTTFAVTNAGEVSRHCSAFDPADPTHVVVYKEIAQGAGRKLVAKRGAPAACP
jgi:cysteine-rich repeat protein